MPSFPPFLAKFLFRAALQCLSFGRTSIWPNNNYIACRVLSQISSERSYVGSGDPGDFFSTENNSRFENLLEPYRARKIINLKQLKKIDNKVEIEASIAHSQY